MVGSQIQVRVATFTSLEMIYVLSKRVAHILLLWFTMSSSMAALKLHTFDNEILLEDPRLDCNGTAQGHFR